MADLKKDMTYLRAGHDDLQKTVEDGMKEIVENIKCLDKKFSAKWVETLIVWIGGIVGTAIISGLLFLIIRATIQFYEK